MSLLIKTRMPSSAVSRGRCAAGRAGYPYPRWRYRRHWFVGGAAGGAADRCPGLRGLSGMGEYASPSFQSLLKGNLRG